MIPKFGILNFCAAALIGLASLYVALPYNSNYVLSFSNNGNVCKISKPHPVSNFFSKRHTTENSHRRMVRVETAAIESMNDDWSDPIGILYAGVGYELGGGLVLTPYHNVDSITKFQLPFSPYNNQKFFVSIYDGESEGVRYGSVVSKDFYKDLALVKAFPREFDNQLEFKEPESQSNISTLNPEKKDGIHPLIFASTFVEKSFMTQYWTRPNMSHGMSGSPVLHEGALVGMVTKIAQHDATMAFAVPAADIVEFIKSYCSSR